MGHPGVHCGNTAGVFSSYTVKVRKKVARQIISFPYNNCEDGTGTGKSNFDCQKFVTGATPQHTQSSVPLLALY